MVRGLDWLPKWKTSFGDGRLVLSADVARDMKTRMSGRVGEMEDMVVV